MTETVSIRAYGDFYDFIERINAEIQEDDPAKVEEGGGHPPEEFINFHNRLVAEMRRSERHGLLYCL